jgi:hypothetical protein
MSDAARSAAGATVCTPWMWCIRGPASKLESVALEWQPIAEVLVISVGPAPGRWESMKEKWTCMTSGKA